MRIEPRLTLLIRLPHSNLRRPQFSKRWSFALLASMASNCPLNNFGKLHRVKCYIFVTDQCKLDPFSPVHHMIYSLGKLVSHFLKRWHLQYFGVSENCGYTYQSGIWVLCDVIYLFSIKVYNSTHIAIKV